MSLLHPRGRSRLLLAAANFPLQPVSEAPYLPAAQWGAWLATCHPKGAPVAPVRSSPDAGPGSWGPPHWVGERHSHGL